MTKEQKENIFVNDLSTHLEKRVGYEIPVHISTKSLDIALDKVAEQIRMYEIRRKFKDVPLYQTLLEIDDEKI